MGCCVSLISFLCLYFLSTPTVIVVSIFIGTFLSCFLAHYWLIEKPTKHSVAEQVAIFGRDAAGSTMEDVVKHYVARSAKAGGEIDNCASELAINSAEISFFLDQLSAAINDSCNDVDRLATAAEQMSSNTREINDNATLASQQSNHAMDATAKGSQQLAVNIDIINQLNHDVIDASGKIKSLSEKAAEIQSITNVIDGISGQTNLLALNAAIEAARAGEQGRGFAVVADEVRALASKTAEATEQIGNMLNQVSAETEQTTSVMNQIVEQTNSVVDSMGELSESLGTSNQLMSEASGASDQISHALQEQNSTTDEISSAIVNLHDFLIAKSEDTHQVSTKASELSISTEAIFSHLAEFETGSLIESMCERVQQVATEIGGGFEKSITKKVITQSSLFDFNYQKITNTNPVKYRTSFDDFTDKVLPKIQEPLLAEFDEVIFCAAVDINGYLPTHNKCFSKPLTGDYDVDFSQSRTKRMFVDPTGIRCAQHTDKFLLQTYKRDTGEIMHDVSAPIFVNGKHWGGFRIGFVPAKK